MKNYKGFIIKTNPLSPTMFTVAVEGRGGKIPKVLEGSFTSFKVVSDIIDKYSDTRKGSVKNDNEANSTE